MTVSVKWCNICNARPADGQLTVLIEDIPEVIDACEPCVYDKEKVEFV